MASTTAAAHAAASAADMGSKVAAVFTGIRELGPEELPTTAPDSYAEARALLLCVALALYPIMRKHPEVFDGFVVSQLRESDPQADAMIKSGTFVEFVGARTIVLRLRCRSATHTNQVLDGRTLVEQALQRLVEGVVGVVPAGLEEGAAVRAAAAATEAGRARAAEILAEFRSSFADRVPLCDAHLIAMGALPPRYKEEYKEAGGVVGRAGRLGGAGADIDGRDEPFRRLWWPISSAAVPLPTARAAAEAARTAAKTDRDLRAIEARKRLLGGHGHGSAGAAAGGAGSSLSP